MALQVSLMGVMGRRGSQDGVGGPASSRGVSFGVDEPPDCGGTEGEPVGAAHVNPPRERRHCLRQALAGRDAGGLPPLQP